jgi:hypothetical protein
MSANDSTGSGRYTQVITTFLEKSAGNPDLVERCFWELKSAYDSYGKRFTRWAVFGVAFVCVFELINRRLVSKASISGIDLSHLDFLLYVMPPLIALSFFNLATLNLEQNIFGGILAELAKQRFTGLSESKILDLLISQQGTFSASLPESIVSPKVSRANLINLIIFVLFALGCYVAFEIYAYIELFTHRQTSTVATTISLIVTLCIFAAAAPSLFVAEAIDLSE